MRERLAHDAMTLTLLRQSKAKEKDFKDLMKKMNEEAR